MPILENIEKYGKDISDTLIRAVEAERGLRKSKLSMAGVSILSQALQPRQNPDGTVTIPTMFDPKIRSLAVAVSPFVPQETIKNLITAASDEMKARTQKLGYGDQLMYIDPTTGEAKPISGRMPDRPLQETTNAYEMFLQNPEAYKAMRKIQHDLPTTFGRSQQDIKTAEKVRAESEQRWFSLREQYLKENPKLSAKELNEKLNADPIIASNQEYLQKHMYKEGTDMWMQMFQGLLGNLPEGNGNAGGGEEGKIPPVPDWDKK